MYGRYVLPQLAKNEKRAIYTDLDVAFVGDIQQLWDEPLEGRTIGAVPSQRGRINRHYQEYKLTNGLDPEHDVFMSGLLLIDCEKWREEGITERLLEVSRRELLLDQETMNIVFDHNRYQKLDAKYCVIYKLLNTCFLPEEKEALLRRQVGHLPWNVHHSRLPSLVRICKPSGFRNPPPPSKRRFRLAGTDSRPF